MAINKINELNICSLYIKECIFAYNDSCITMNGKPYYVIRFKTAIASLHHFNLGFISKDYIIANDRIILNYSQHFLIDN